MNKLICAICVVLAGFVQAETEQELKAGALKGDHQSQRNLAFSYATGWLKPGEKNYVPKKPVEACAWYKVILMLDSPKLHVGDYSNEVTYCNKLSLEDSMKAWQLAKVIQKQVKSK